MNIATISNLEDRTSEDDLTGEVRSIQAADLSLPEAALRELWTPSHLERLARTYWRFLSRVTLGLVRVRYSETGRSLVLLAPALKLITFAAPEYEMDSHHGLVRWRIARGLLVARRGRDSGGYLQIEVRRPPDWARADTAQTGGVQAAHPRADEAQTDRGPAESPAESPAVGESQGPAESPAESPAVGESQRPAESPAESPAVGESQGPAESPSESPAVGESQRPRPCLHFEIEVSGFYPAIASGLGRRIYGATQSRIHVIITRGFLRSLARLDLAESRVGRFSGTDGASDDRDASSTPR